MNASGLVYILVKGHVPAVVKVVVIRVAILLAIKHVLVAVVADVHHHVAVLALAVAQEVVLDHPKAIVILAKDYARRHVRAGAKVVVPLGVLAVVPLGVLVNVLPDVRADAIQDAKTLAIMVVTLLVKMRAKVDVSILVLEHVKEHAEMDVEACAVTWQRIFKRWKL